VRNKFRFERILGGLVAAAFACAAGVASAAGTATVAGNVATWVKSAKLMGAASADTSVTVAVHMSVNNAASLKALVAEVSNPKSKEYGRYLTPQEFGLRFEPSGADVAAVKTLLEHAGMTNVVQGPHGMYVTASATVAQLRSAFKVSQNLYSFQGKTLRANKEAPTIPASLAGKVLFIEGLDDSSLLRTPFHTSVSMGALVAPATVKSTAAAVTPPPVAAGNPPAYCNENYGAGEHIATLTTSADVYGAAIPWMNCGYTPQQIQAAYGIANVKYNGKGVTVAILDAYASPTLESDANRYAANHSLPKLTSSNFSEIIPAGIYDVSPDESCGPYGWWTEQSLDVDAVHGSAPGATILFVGSRDCGTSLTVAFMNVVYNHLSDVVTNSYGFDGEDIAPGSQSAFDQAAMAGAVQGMTVLFSSGDDGDLSALNGAASGSWPATSAYVTGVGGTTLEIVDLSGDKSEYGWGNYRAFLADVTVKSDKLIEDSGVTTVSNYGYTYDDYSFYAGSGGGISLLESQPSYQAGIVSAALATTLNLASTETVPLPNPMRVSPDVAMVADPYTGYLYGETFTIAGNAIADAGCKAISKTEEYCETAIGGTSLASPLMAGVMAIMDQKREALGEPVVGFANPLLYGVGSEGNGVVLRDAINQIIAPTDNVAFIRSYQADLNEARVVTINSVPFNIQTSPYAIITCGITICLGVDDVFNYTSLSSAGGTGRGYNDVTGLGVPWVPKLINEE